MVPQPWDVWLNLRDAFDVSVGSSLSIVASHALKIVIIPSLTVIIAHLVFQTSTRELTSKLSKFWKPTPKDPVFQSHYLWARTGTIKSVSKSTFTPCSQQHSTYEKTIAPPLPISPRGHAGFLERCWSRPISVFSFGVARIIEIGRVSKFERLSG